MLSRRSRAWLRWGIFSLPLLLALLYAARLALAGKTAVLPGGGFQFRTDNYYWNMMTPPEVLVPLIGMAAFFLLTSGVMPARFQPRGFRARFAVVGLVLWGLAFVLFRSLSGLFPPAIYSLLIAPALSGIAAWYLARIPWKRRTGGEWRAPWWFPAALAPLVLAPLLLHVSHVYQWQILVSDSHSQISQARLLAQGRFVHDIPQGLREVLHIVYATETVPTFSQYPPGHATLMAGVLLLGVIPQALNMAASVLAVALVGLILRRHYGVLPAAVGMFLLVCSPHFLVMGAGAMNHATCALALLAVVWAILASPRDGPAPRPWACALAGFGLAWAFATRPLTAVSHGVFWAGFLGWMLASAPRMGLARRHVLHLAGYTIAGALPPLVYLLIYNLQTTGNPLVFAYNAHAGDMMRFGFGTDRPHPYTPLDALNRFAASLSSFHFQMTGWAIGSWVLILVWWKRTRLRRIEGPLLALILLQWGAYSLYHYHDLLVGPRFHFEILPALIMLAAAGLAPVLRRGGLRRVLLLVIMGFLGVGAVKDGLDYWRGRYRPMIAANLRVQEVIEAEADPDVPTVFVFGRADGESSGRNFPPLPDEPEVWFVRSDAHDKARNRPEFEGARWVVRPGPP